jgi:hypothetical protein
MYYFFVLGSSRNDAWNQAKRPPRHGFLRGPGRPGRCTNLFFVGRAGQGGVLLHFS